MLFYSSILAVYFPTTLSRLQSLIRQLEQTLLPFDQQWWVHLGRASAKANVGNQVRPVTDEDIGLKVLRNPTSDTTDGENVAKIVDIIAIHGIGAHPDDTWCKPVGTGESLQWVNWLEAENMLPAVAPHARIMRYGYQSQWFGEEAIRQTMSTVARRLLLALRRKRTAYPKRPLLFIAHCFGGLVVLKALLDARYDDSEWPGIFASTTGLIFLGTPFRGAGGMSQVEMLAAAQREYQVDEIQPEVLKILEPDNEFLRDILDKFGKTRKEANKAQVACFYELKPSNVGRIVGNTDRKTFVVSETSGCLELSEGISKFSLSRTHFDMNKFSRPTEEDFETVWEVIETMLQASLRDNYYNLSMTSLSLQNTSGSFSLPSPATPLSNVSQDLYCLPIPSSPISASQKPRGKKKVREWSSAEDEMLVSVVQKTKPLKWARVAEYFEKRSPYACEKRFEKVTGRVR